MAKSAQKACTRPHGNSAFHGVAPNQHHFTTIRCPSVADKNRHCAGLGFLGRLNDPWACIDSSQEFFRANRAGDPDDHGSGIRMGSQLE